MRLRSAGGPKTPVEVLPPSLKVAASYTPGVRERMQAKAAGFDDVIFRTVDGDLAEGTTQSIFVVQGETLLLPPLDVVLDGVTRRLMIDVAQHVGVHVLIRGVFWDEVLNADELFLCSTNYPVSPVRQVDNRSFALPGPVATRLAKEVEALFTGEHPLAQRWLTPVSGRRRP